ncbi:hypothetical protein OG746_29310 [Streptomyces sp. NBC_01016]|uniref:hypothetical protein n=1 Tax=Streptomyces sp. NBC_01016 TaxID=2903720 RepID=UPI00225132EE|nr:hypothetical protein [Streptomyces sp. NBC_01016]MCX4832837.1 hypothetical protein [Streptomyces sp. NBC_01016]
MDDQRSSEPTPADVPARKPSPETVQRAVVRDLITGTALKLTASTDIDLDALEVLAKLVDAQTRAQEANLRRIQFYDAKTAR